MKKKLLLIIIFIVALISLILYYTYAIDVSMESTTGAVDLVLNVDIKNPSNRTVTVEAGKTKILDMVISNSNGVSINYGIAYSGTKPSKVKIAQLNTSRDTVSGTISNNATKYVTLVIENKSSTNYTYTLLPISGYQNGGSLIVPNNYTLITDIYAMLPAKASDYIMSLSQGDTYATDSGNGVYATNAYDDNGVTKYHEYRYVGGEVNNYVKFNNDLYQIIGVFDDNSHGVTGQQLVKLIAARELTSASWGAYNAATAYTTYSSYKNDWTGTTTGVPASANILLNEFFLNPAATSTYGECINWTYASNNNIYKSKNCSNIKGYGIQTNTLRNYIQPVTWYLYGYTSAGLTKQDWYQCERNNYSGCTSGNSGAYSGTATASIGLMYVSDYLYASGYIASNLTASGSSSMYIILNWLYNGLEWTITPQGNSDNMLFRVYDEGNINSTSSISSNGLLPVFYLKSTVKIKQGIGTLTNPYILE